MEQSKTPLETQPPKERITYQPEISVVVPVLNRVHEISRLLDSFKKQEYGGKVNYIIADAGSTDGTVELCGEAGVIIAEAPKGTSIGETRKAGCEMATGEIIVNTDSDCVLQPNYLKAVARAFEDPEVIASHGPNEYGYKGNPPEGPTKRLLQNYISWDLRRRHKKGQPMLNGHNFAVLASVYNVLGGFDPRTHRIEEPVLYQLLWEMPGKITWIEGQKVRTELAWQKDGKPSLERLREYKKKNLEWTPTAVDVIKERKRELKRMKQEVSDIVNERRSRLLNFT